MGQKIETQEDKLRMFPLEDRLRMRLLEDKLRMFSLRITGMTYPSFRTTEEDHWNLVQEKKRKPAPAEDKDSFLPLEAKPLEAKNRIGSLRAEDAVPLLSLG